MISLSKSHQLLTYSSLTSSCVTLILIQYTHTRAHTASCVLKRRCPIPVEQRVCDTMRFIDLRRKVTSKRTTNGLKVWAERVPSQASACWGQRRGRGEALSACELDVLPEAPADRAISTSPLRATSPPSLGTEDLHRVTALCRWLSLCLAPSRGWS